MTLAQTPGSLSPGELLAAFVAAEDAWWFHEAAEAGWQSYQERDAREANEEQLGALRRELDRRGLLAAVPGDYFA